MYKPHPSPPLWGGRWKVGQESFFHPKFILGLLNFSLSQYVKIFFPPYLQNIKVCQTSRGWLSPLGELEGAITLRWLLRRGSPLPIPNRVVKPACADGTAVMWESMSSPFFKNPSSNDEGFFVVLYRRIGLADRLVGFSLGSHLAHHSSILFINT